MRLVAFFAVVFSLVVSLAIPAGAQTTGLAYTEDVVYTVLDDSVRVELTATMTNTTIERREGDTVFFTFFDTVVFIAPTGLTNLSIASEGTLLASSAEPLDEDFDVVTAVLPEQLRSGESRTVDVSYTLPRGELRSDGAFFSNPAYHGFPLWSFSDPGTGSLTLRVPEDAQVVELGSAIVEGTLSDGFVEWTPESFDIPADFFTYINVVREERLVERSFEVAGQDIVIRSWPGDTEWAEFAEDSITQGIPALEDEIGSPIPEQDGLEVTSSIAPIVLGYAGRYDPAQTSIEIGNELDRGVLLHELSHAWFNNTLFIDRWMIEGLAEEFSYQIDRDLGEGAGELPDTPRPTDAGAVPLNEWSSLALASGNEISRERELYGYNASWFAVRELVEIVGEDGLRELIQAADSGVSAYPAAPRSLLLNDWRVVLDLASTLTDTDGEAALDALWLELVVDDQQAELIADRREVRDQYLRFADRPLQWSVPADIDQAMADWRFDDARELLREASRVLDLQRRVLDQADLAGLDAAEAGREAYEQIEPDFDQALSVLAVQEEAISSVVDVRELAAVPLTREEQAGLGDFDLASVVERAERAYELNRFDDVADVREQLISARAQAAESGATRLLWSRLGLGAAVALVLLGIVKLVKDRPWSDAEPLTREESHA